MLDSGVKNKGHTRCFQVEHSRKLVVDLVLPVPLAMIVPVAMLNNFTDLDYLSTQPPVE